MEFRSLWCVSCEVVSLRRVDLFCGACARLELSLYTERLRQNEKQKHMVVVIAFACRVASFLVSGSPWLVLVLIIACPLDSFDLGESHPGRGSSRTTIQSVVITFSSFPN